VRARRLRIKQELEEERQIAIEAMRQQLDIDSYVAANLARVRKQLDKVAEMLLREDDPAKIDRLASAQSRLAEQERQLAGRPLPGSLRPNNKPERNRPDALPQAGFSHDSGNGQ
jgi:hypothetical protein